MLKIKYGDFLEGPEHQAINSDHSMKKKKKANIYSISSILNKSLGPIVLNYEEKYICPLDHLKGHRSRYKEEN